MIIKVSQHIYGIGKSYFIVEYDTGKRKKYTRVTKSIAQFVEDKAPEITIYVDDEIIIDFIGGKS